MSRNSLAFFLLVVAIALVANGQSSYQNGAISTEGGMMALMKANEPLAKGNVVCPNSLRMGVIKVPTSGGLRQAPVGVVYSDASGSSSVASGSWCWVVHHGIADVLFDGSATAGQIIHTSAVTAGTAYSDDNLPPITQAEHNGEIGHNLESRTGAGIARAMLHWN